MLRILIALALALGLAACDPHAELREDTRLNEAALLQIALMSCSNVGVLNRIKPVIELYVLEAQVRVEEGLTAAEAERAIARRTGKMLAALREQALLDDLCAQFETLTAN